MCKTEPNIIASYLRGLGEVPRQHPQIIESTAIAVRRECSMSCIRWVLILSDQVCVCVCVCVCTSNGYHRTYKLLHLDQQPFHAETVYQDSQQTGERGK